jgi:CheY-like chemotaxis protein
MPEMDGYTATMEIRKRQHQLGPIPIIAMTAHAMDSELRKCIKSGMNDHITKPIDPEELFSTLTKWIKPKNKVYGVPNPEKRHDKKRSILPDHLPGIDKVAGLTRVAGKESIFRDLLQKIRNKYHMLPDKIALALKSSDLERACNLAHMIKGVAGNIGADRVYEKASELESAIRQNRAAEYRVRLKEFSKELTLIMSTIDTLISSTTAVDDDTATMNRPEKVIQMNLKSLQCLQNGLYAKLTKAVEAAELDVAQQIVDHIQEYNEPLAGALLELINAYKFDTLHALLQTGDDALEKQVQGTGN